MLRSERKIIFCGILSTCLNKSKQKIAEGPTSTRGFFLQIPSFRGVSKTDDVERTCFPNPPFPLIRPIVTAAGTFEFTASTQPRLFIQAALFSARLKTVTQIESRELWPYSLTVVCHSSLLYPAFLIFKNANFMVTEYNGGTYKTFIILKLSWNYYSLTPFWESVLPHI